MEYDGFVELEAKTDGIYIIVYSPKNDGKRVTLEEAINFIKSRGVLEYDYEALKFAVNSNNDKEEKKISNLTALKSVDEQLLVEVSKNKLFLVICFKEPKNGGKILSKDTISSILNSQGIVYGIDYEELDKILANKKYNYKYLIGKGLEPINGKNGVLKFHFDASKKNIKPKITEDGSVDFKDYDLIETVKKGQVLVTALPSDDGREGKDIFGKEIQNIKGKKAVLPKGKNIEISADGQKLISQIDGQITYIDGRINIYSTYEVPANVDNSTGNIEFVGNILIKGNVLTGFTIKAGGNIEVYGVVEGAELESDGDIILYRGMQGINKGTLNAKGSITAKYIENSNIRCNGDIQANAIMHSEVRCGGSIFVEGRKGLLVGGIVRASKEIKAKTIGSPMATATEIEVGINPEILENYRNLKIELENIKSECHKMEQLIEPLTHMRNHGKISPDKELMLAKSLKTKTFLQNKLEHIQYEIGTLEPKIQDRMDGRVKVSNVIYPGVKLTIGNIYTYIREETKFCTAVSEHAEIKFYPYA